MSDYTTGRTLRAPATGKKQQLVHGPVLSDALLDERHHWHHGAQEMGMKSVRRGSTVHLDHDALFGTRLQLHTYSWHG